MPVDIGKKRNINVYQLHQIKVTLAMVRTKSSSNGNDLRLLLFLKV